MYASLIVSVILWTFAIFHDNNKPRYTLLNCEVPTVFTPNDDGENDELIIPCLTNLAQNDSELMIFNEWGDRVFYAKPYLNNWKGNYKTHPLPDGTYFYLFRVSQADNFKKGYTTIFR